jgi:hypothetical protein
VRGSLSFLVVCLLALLALPSRAAAATPSVAPDWAGVNAQWLYPAYPQNGAVWNAQTDTMARAGVKVVRLDAEWRRVEQNAPNASGHHYDWRFYDAVVATLAKRGIRWYPIVDYSAPWSGTIPGAWRSPPASLDAYAEYAGALVRRYGRGGEFWAAHPELPRVPVQQWELWNEENGAYFWPSAPDPVRYAALYEQTRTAIHAVDPAATAVVGGLINHSAGWFLWSMLQARPGMTIDAVGLHAYADTVPGALAWIRGIRSVLTTAGRPNVPIEVTEVGWTTQGSAVATSEAARAALIRQLLPAVAAEPGVTRLILHTWVSREQYASQPEDWYGLFHPDATPSASGTAFVQALAGLRPAAATATAPVASPAPVAPAPVRAVAPAAPVAPVTAPRPVASTPAPKAQPKPKPSAKKAKPKKAKKVKPKKAKAKNAKAKHRKKHRRPAKRHGRHAKRR